MSLLHILTNQTGTNNYNAVAHIAVSSGVNSAGMLWTDIVKTAGLNTTQLSVGIGPGQISSSEKASLDAGTLLEYPTLILDNPTLVSSSRLAFIDSQVVNITTDVLNILSIKYQFYGLVRG